MNEPGAVKILLEIEDEEGNIELESVWAEQVSNGYRIDNIPFYAFGLAFGDVVAATPDPDGMLRYTRIVEPSGHSTVRLWFANEEDVPGVRAQIGTMGCGSELDLPRLVAVDVPHDIDYVAIKDFLDAKEAEGVFEYEEACLGQTAPE